MGLIWMLQLILVILRSTFVASDFASIVQLSTEVYGHDSLTCEQSYTYLTRLYTLYHQDFENNDLYISDSMVEVSHMVDYILLKLESVTQTNVRCLYDAAKELAKIANDMLSSINSEICLTIDLTQCSLSPFKAIPMISDTESSLLRAVNIIATDAGIPEVTIMDQGLTVTAAKGSVRDISQLHKIGGIIEAPTPGKNVSLDLEIVLFVIANKQNMYSFVKDSTFLNEGTVRSFVQNMQGEYMEIFDEIHIHVESSNMRNFNDKVRNPPPPNITEVSSDTTSDDLDLSASFDSDLDGGLFLIAIAGTKQCTTALRNMTTGEEFIIITEDTGTVLFENTTDDVTVRFSNKTLTILMLPPVKNYHVTVYCEACLKTADIVFIADASASVKVHNFELMKLFMAELVGLLPVSPSGVRIGLMTFAYENRYIFYLNTFDHAADVKARINTTVYDDVRWTGTAGALRGSREVMFGTHGSGRDVQRMTIIITDGVSTNSAELTETEADNLRLDGIEVVAIGIGDGIDMNELTRIADSESHLFTVQNFSALMNLSDSLIETICSGELSEMQTNNGGFGSLSGFILDGLANAWRRSPALQLKDVEENTVIFKSDFFGTFGFNLFGKAPETINFEEVFTNIDEKIKDTPHVLALNCALLAALAVGTVILNYFDRNDQKMWSYRSLPENPANGEFVYFISLHTGLFSSRKFTSTPYIMLTGWYGDSGVRALTATCEGLYSWKFANFALSTEEHLGPLTEIRIWHANEQDTERLYIEKILVADASEGAKYAFLCEDWLAVDRADGCTYRTLFPAHSELQDGKTLFSSITRFNMFDDYLWLSMLSRPSFSRFTRVQRLYAVSSMISLSMLGSSMWFNTKSDEHIYGIQVGPFNINYMQIYIGVMSSLISLPSCFAMAIIFRNRRLRGEWKQKGTDQYQMNISSGAFFPWPFVFVGYGVGAASIGCGSFFTTLYSLQWGPEISEEWIMSILFGTSADVMFIEPLKVVLVSLLLAGVLKGTAKKSILEMAPFDIENCEITKGDISPSEWPGDKDKSKTEEDYRKQLLLDRKLHMHLRKLTIDLIYIAILVLIVSHNNIQSAYLQNNHLLNLLQPSKKINTSTEIWDWLSEQYIPKVFPKLHYNGVPRLPPERKLMADDTTHKLGPVRLRQLRVKGKCNIPSEMRTAMKLCIPKYSEKNQDTLSYCPGWTPYLSKCEDDGFRYVPLNTTSAFSYYGIYHKYGGDGYVKDLNPFKVEIQHELRKLRESNWIDNATRFLMVDLVLLNGNTKLFSSIAFIFEFPTVGDIVTGTNIQTGKLYPYVDVWDYIVLFAQVAFVLIAFIRCLLFTYDVWTLKWDCFTSLTFYASFVSIAFSVTAVVCYIIRIDRTIYIIEKIFNSADEFLSFESVQFYDDIYKMSVGVVLFIAILVMLKSLSFNYYLYMMRAAIIITKSDMMSFSVLLAIPMTAFACITHLYMGSYSYAFRNMLSSFLSLFRTLLAMVKFKDLFGGSDSIDSELLFSFFIFMMTIVLMNMFICILNDGFSYVKDRGGNLTELEPFDSELNDHFWYKVDKLFSCFKSNSDKYEAGDQANSPLNSRISDLESRLDNDANDDVKFIKAVFQAFQGK